MSQTASNSLVDKVSSRHILETLRSREMLVCISIFQLEFGVSRVGREQIKPSQKERFSRSLQTQLRFDKDHACPHDFHRGVSSTHCAWQHSTHVISLGEFSFQNGL